MTLWTLAISVVALVSFFVSYRSTSIAVHCSERILIQEKGSSPTRRQKSTQHYATEAEPVVLSSISTTPVTWTTATATGTITFTTQGPTTATGGGGGATTSQPPPSPPSTPASGSAKSSGAETGGLGVNTGGLAETSAETDGTIPTTVCFRGCSTTEQIAPLNHWHTTTGGFANAFDAVLQAMPKLRSSSAALVVGWDSVGSCGSFDGRGLPWERLLRKFFPKFRPRPRTKAEGCSEALLRAPKVGLQEGGEGGVVLEYFVDQEGRAGELALPSGVVAGQKTGDDSPLLLRVPVHHQRRVVVVDWYTQEEGFPWGKKQAPGVWPRHAGERGCWTMPYIERRADDLRRFAAQRLGVDLSRRAAFFPRPDEERLSGTTKRRTKRVPAVRPSPSFLANPDKVVVPENGLPKNEEEERELRLLQEDMAANVRDLLEEASAGTTRIGNETKTRPFTVLLTLRLDQKKEPRAVFNLRELLLSLDAVFSGGNSFRGSRFLVVEPGDLSLEEQIRLFLQVDLFLFMHGATAANTLWLPPGALVVEIQPGDAWHCMFSFMQRGERTDHRPPRRWHWVLSSAAAADGTVAGEPSPDVAAKDATGEVSSLWFDTAEQCGNHEMGFDGSQKSRKNRGKWIAARKSDGRVVGGERLSLLLRNVLEAAREAAAVGREDGQDGVSGVEEGVLEPAMLGPAVEKGLERTRLAVGGGEDNVLRRGVCSGHAWQLFEEGSRDKGVAVARVREGEGPTSANTKNSDSSATTARPGRSSKKIISRSDIPFLCEDDMPPSPLPVPPEARKSGLVVVLNSLRSGDLAWPSFEKHVLAAGLEKGYQLDLALSVGSFAVSTTNPFFTAAKYVWQVPDPVGGNWTENWLDVYRACRKDTDVAVDLGRFQRAAGGKDDPRGTRWIMLNGVGARLTPPTFTQHFFKFVALQKILTLKLYEKYGFVVLTRADQVHLSDHVFPRDGFFSGGTVLSDFSASTSAAAHDRPKVSDSAISGRSSSEEESATRTPDVFSVRSQEWGGICDRHLVFSMPHIVPALSVLEPLVRGQFPAQHDDLTKWEFQNTESLLAKFLEWRGLRVGKGALPRTMFTTCCANNNGTTFTRKGTTGGGGATWGGGGGGCVGLDEDRRYRTGSSSSAIVGLSAGNNVVSPDTNVGLFAKYVDEARAAIEVCVERERDRTLAAALGKNANAIGGGGGGKTAGRTLPDGLTGCCCVDAESCRSEVCDVVPKQEQCVD